MLGTATFHREGLVSSTVGRRLAGTRATKRAERLLDFFANHPVPPNAWLGVTVEDRRYGLPRIEHLRRVSARIRFLSVEPLLEDLGPLDLDGIDWVIVGGELRTSSLFIDMPKILQQQGNQHFRHVH